MPGPSADERIKRFLKRRAQERAQAEVTRQEHDEREQQHERIIERIKAKWTADVDLIAAILAELQAKLADEDLEVRFQDIGPSGDAIVRGLITGRFLGEPINVTLNVYASGIELHKAGPTGGYSNEEFASTSKLSILNAGKGESSVHVAFAHVSRPERYASDSTAFPTLKDTGLKAFHGYLKEIDGMLAEREWFSDRYTVLDPYGFVFYTWGVRRQLPMGELKNYTAFKNRMLERPPVGRVVDGEQIKV